MEKKTAHKRRAPISYRPPREREDEFYARVSESGLSVNAFLTDAVFGRSRYRPAEMRKLAQLLSACAVIRDALDALPEADHEVRAEVLAAIHAELSEVRAALLKLMGRKP